MPCIEEHLAVHKAHLSYAEEAKKAQAEKEYKNSLKVRAYDLDVEIKKLQEEIQKKLKELKEVRETIDK